MTALVPLWPEFAFKPHQEIGVTWIIEREDDEPSGGIVCDEMGLGKTIQLLAVLKLERLTKTILIAPVAVLTQWEQAAKKSGITVYRPKVAGLQQEWVAESFASITAAKIYLIGYEMALSRPHLIIEKKWTRLICDEAHRVASSSNRLHEMVSIIEADHRWFLTATPIVNSEKDIKGLLKLLRVDGPWTLKESVGMYVMARSMDDLRASIRDAPPKPIIHRISLPFLTEEERDFYKNVSGLIVKRWKMLEDEGGPGVAIMRLKLFMRLRQISVHPQVYIEARKGGRYTQNHPNWLETSTKFHAVKRLIEKGGPKHKWIVFSHFHTEMELLQKELLGLPTVGKVHLYNGSISAAERTAIIEESKEESPLTQVLLIQLQSGGVGLNLQHFDRIVFTGPWWTSALMEQAIGRAVRIGQHETVQVYHLTLIEEEALNIDRFMSQKAEAKGTLCKEILGAAWPRAPARAKTTTKEEATPSKET